MGFMTIEAKINSNDFIRVLDEDCLIAYYNFCCKETRLKDGDMVCNKTLLLLTGLACRIAGLAQPSHPILTDTFSGFFPYVLNR